MRIEGLEHRFNSLLLTDGHELGEVHWQITDLGTLLLGVKAEPEYSHDFHSPAVIGQSDLGRWVHLVCVYDGDEGIVRHYLDGREDSATKIRTAMKLRFGPSEIGNWSAEDFTVSRIRSLNGRIDEFGIMGVPLSGNEVKRDLPRRKASVVDALIALFCSQLHR